MTTHSGWFAIERRDAVRFGSAAALAALFRGPGLALAADASPNVLEAMQRDGRFARWLDLIGYTGLQRFMTGEGGRVVPFTMFAPTDTALTPYQDLIKELRLNTPFPNTFRVTRLIRSYTVPGQHPPAEFAGKTVRVNGFDGNPVQLDGRNPKASQIVLLLGSMKSVNTIGPNLITTSNSIVYPLDSVDLRMIYAW